MKRNNIIIIAIFILFLIGPNISYFFVKDKVDLINYEKRDLSEKPALSFSELQTYPENFEKYYNDNIPYKNEIRNLRSLILYKYFDTGSNSKVIVGKNGWLFYNSGEQSGDGPILDYRNTTSYSQEVYDSTKEIIVNTNNELNKKGIEFYVLVAPNKENTYSDYLEGIVKRSNREESRTEELINYLKNNTEINIIYPKEALVNGRNTCNTYYKYDTHWNNYGAYLGVIELMKTIDSKFKEPEIQISMQTINEIGNDSSSREGRDLLDMNSIYYNVKDKEPIINGFYDNVKYEYEFEEETEFKKSTSKNAIYDKTILFVGDSFRSAMFQYVSKLYSNTVFVHRNRYNEDYINKYHPDIVVYETVERSAHALSNIGDLIK